MFTRRPRTIILTHQDDLTQMLGRHPDLMHESGTGKILIRAAALDDLRHREIQKKLIKERKLEFVAMTGVEKPTDAVGASRREKNRLTLIMRQCLEGHFDEELKVPTGKILDSVLLVPAAKHARLEDMSMYEPSIWLRDHKFEIDGIPTVRKKGDRVGTLGREWRNARRRHPSLFYRNRGGAPTEWKHGLVRVWFQPKSTEDTIIASMLSDQIVEDTRHIFMEAFLNIN